MYSKPRVVRLSNAQAAKRIGAEKFRRNEAVGQLLGRRSKSLRKEFGGFGRRGGRR